jgi:adenylate kinase
VCGECGKNYNIASINVPATADSPAIMMPPLDPPAKCAGKMQTRPDDTPEVVRARLAVYHAECGPVEAHYAADGRLAEFHITAGIPETLPLLLADVLALVRRQRAAGAQA